MASDSLSKVAPTLLQRAGRIDVMKERSAAPG
jgi:hypothetical protein